MTDFNLSEKLIILAILTAIMEADGIIDSHETEYLDAVIATYGMTETQLDLLDDIDITEAYELFKKFEPQKKNIAIDMFKKMSACDGYVDPRELDIINRL